MSNPNHVTYADFRIACVLPFADLGGPPREDFPRIEPLHERLMNIPGWGDPFVRPNAPEPPPVKTAWSASEDAMLYGKQN